MTNKIALEPTVEDERMLNGRLWVLTDEQNYSAAKTFISFCKQINLLLL